MSNSYSLIWNSGKKPCSLFLHLHSAMQVAQKWYTSPLKIVTGIQLISTEAKYCNYCIKEIFVIIFLFYFQKQYRELKLPRQKVGQTFWETWCVLLCSLYREREQDTEGGRFCYFTFNHFVIQSSNWAQITPASPINIPVKTLISQFYRHISNTLNINPEEPDKSSHQKRKEVNRDWYWTCCRFSNSSLMGDLIQLQVSWYVCFSASSIRCLWYAPARFPHMKMMMFARI